MEEWRLSGPWRELARVSAAWTGVTALERRGVSRSGRGVGHPARGLRVYFVAGRWAEMTSWRDERLGGLGRSPRASYILNCGPQD